MTQMHNVNNVCFSVNPYPIDVEHSQENVSSFNGQKNESLPLHHTQNIPSHSASQIKSNPKSRRDIAGTKRSLNLYTYQNYL